MRLFGDMYEHTYSRVRRHRDLFANVDVSEYVCTLDDVWL
jgi:hypothetical protein